MFLFLCIEWQAAEFDDRALSNKKVCGKVLKTVFADWEEATPINYETTGLKSLKCKTGATEQKHLTMP